MAIQTQLYRSNNAFSSFPNNGSCAAATGLIDPHFNSQHKPHQQQQQSQQHLRDCQGRVADPNLQVHDSKASFPILLNKQFEEIDQYIRFQNENLRYRLQEHGKQQVTALVKKLESRSLDVLRVKDEEIARAEKRRMELEEYLRNLEAETSEWERMAKEKEKIALALYKTLEEMREGGYHCSSAMAEDAVSFCDETGGENNMGEEGTTAAENGGGGGGEGVRRLCKSCNSRMSCFLFLPCRHLCCCKVCNAFLEACPICRMPKKASIETLIS